MAGSGQGIGILEWTLTVQTIFQAGKPAFVVISYDEYLRLSKSNKWIPEGDGIPHEVVKMTVAGMSELRAWREYMNLQQEDVALAMRITQPALAGTTWVCESTVLFVQLSSPRGRSS